MGDSRVEGCHAVFFYYGAGHLLANMYAYIKEGIEHNEYIYLYIQPDLYERIEKSLPESEKSSLICMQIKVFPLSHGNEFAFIKNEFEGCKRDAIQKGYSGARIILQSNFLFRQLEKKIILDIEKYISDMALSLGISVLCTHDFKEFIRNNENNTFMRDITNVHTHRLSEFNLIRIK